MVIVFTFVYIKLFVLVWMFLAFSPFFYLRFFIALFCAIVSDLWIPKAMKIMSQELRRLARWQAALPTQHLGAFSIFGEREGFSRDFQRGS